MNTTTTTALHPAGEAVFTFPTYGGHVRLCPTDDALTPFGGLVPWAAFQKQGGLIEALAASCPVTRTSPNAAPVYDVLTSFGLTVLCDGRRFVRPMLAVTSPQVKPDADRMGYTQRIEAAGGQVLTGMCFYQSYAREIAQANGWKRLATNSAKLVNILGGYGYVPMLASMRRCVEAAQTGRLA